MKAFDSLKNMENDHIWKRTKGSKRKSSPKHRNKTAAAIKGTADAGGDFESIKNHFITACSLRRWLREALLVPAMYDICRCQK